MDAEFYIALGGVLEAYAQRTFAREAPKAAARALESAKAQEGHFGMFADCGDFYREETAEAKGVMAAAVRNKIAAEKRFKALKLAFFETYRGVGRRELAARLGPQIAGEGETA